MGTYVVASKSLKPSDNQSIERYPDYLTINSVTHTEHNDIYCVSHTEHNAIYCVSHTEHNDILVLKSVFLMRENKVKMKYLPASQ